MANPNKRSPFSKAVTFVDLNGIPGPRGYKYFLWARHFQRDAIGAFTSEGVMKDSLHDSKDARQELQFFQLSEDSADEFFKELRALEDKFARRTKNKYVICLSRRLAVLFKNCYDFAL